MGNNTISIGNAGEYFVAGELERRGFTCGVPMSNSKDFDILAVSRNTLKQYAIQVKTVSGNKQSWLLSKKNEDLTGSNIFYVFVSLNNLDAPKYHVVPSRIVARSIKERHQTWLAKSGRNGQPHKDTAMREFSDPDNKYLDRWDYLK